MTEVKEKQLRVCDDVCRLAALGFVELGPRDEWDA